MKGLGPKLRPRTPDPLAGMPGLAGQLVHWTPPPPVPVSVPDVGRDSKSVRAGHQSHVEIAVCQGKKCSKAGGGALLAAFKVAAREGGSDVTVRACKCRDACKAAPVVEVTSDAGRMLVKVRAAAEKTFLSPFLTSSGPPPARAHIRGDAPAGDAHHGRRHRGFGDAGVPRRPRVTCTKATLRAARAARSDKYR